MLRRRTNSNVLLQSGKHRGFFGGYNSFEKRYKLELQLQVISGKKLHRLKAPELVVTVAILVGMSRSTIESCFFLFIEKLNESNVPVFQ